MVVLHWGNRTLKDAKDCLSGYQRMIAKRKSEGRQLYLRPDPVLGWDNEASSVHPRWGYGTNELGNRRTSSDCVASGSTGALKVALLGNSYVHGDESADDETWAWLLQSKLANDALIHNLGVTAYSTDQAVLRFQSFSEKHPLDVAVLAVTTTDIFRNLNMCRAFILNDREVPLFKPRFAFSGKRVELLKPIAVEPANLVSCLADRTNLAILKAHDYFYPGCVNQAYQIMRRLRVPVSSEWKRFFSDGVHVMEQICRMFLSLCSERGVRPVILLFPVFWGSFPAGKEFDLLKAALQQDCSVLDARELFTNERLALPASELHHQYNHYAVRSSAWLAEYMAAFLRRSVL